MREIISLHVGQPGLQIANSCWEIFCLEHDLRLDGSLINPNANASNLQVLFNESINKKYSPRAALFDGDVGTINSIRTGILRNLFHPNFVHQLETESGSVWPRANHVRDEIVEEDIKKLLEGCDSISGIMIYHSLSGGYGGGFTCKLLDILHNETEKSNKLTITHFPSDSILDQSVVEPYNSVLTLSKFPELTDSNIMFENSALYKLCERHLEKPNFNNLNHMIASSVSSFTQSLRFGGQKNVDFYEMRNHLIPLPKLQLLWCSYAPFIHMDQQRVQSINLDAVTEALFDQRAAFIKFNRQIHKYIGSSLFYRGNCTLFEVKQSIILLQGSKSINFMNGSQKSYQIAITHKEPVLPQNSQFGKTNKSVGMIANSTAILRPLQQLQQRFKILYAKKSFIHWYKGVEELEFQESMETINQVASLYKEQQGGDYPNGVFEELYSEEQYDYQSNLQFDEQQSGQQSKKNTLSKRKKNLNTQNIDSQRESSSNVQGRNTIKLKNNKQKAELNTLEQQQQLPAGKQTAQKNNLSSDRSRQSSNQNRKNIDNQEIQLKNSRDSQQEKLNGQQPGDRILNENEFEVEGEFEVKKQNVDEVRAENQSDQNPENQSDQNPNSQDNLKQQTIGKKYQQGNEQNNQNDSRKQQANDNNTNNRDGKSPQLKNNQDTLGIENNGDSKLKNLENNQDEKIKDIGVGKNSQQDQEDLKSIKIGDDNINDKNNKTDKVSKNDKEDIKNKKDENVQQRKDEIKIEAEGQQKNDKSEEEQAKINKEEEAKKELFNSKQSISLLKEANDFFTENKDYPPKQIGDFLLEYCKLFKQLGAILYFALTDVMEKAQIIKDRGNEYSDQAKGIFAIIEVEKKNGLIELNGKNNKTIRKNNTLSNYKSLGRTMLRILRFFDYLKLVMVEIDKNRDKQFQEICSAAYNETLAPYHTFIVRNAARAAWLAAPQRQKVLEIFAPDQSEETAYTAMREFVSVIEPMRVNFWDYYNSNKLTNLP